MEWLGFACAITRWHKPNLGVPHCPNISNDLNLFEGSQLLHRRLQVCEWEMRVVLFELFQEVANNLGHFLPLRRALPEGFERL
jgi:hypothetical protein